MTDPRFTLPESPELLARAEAVARQRHADWFAAYTDHHLALPIPWPDLGSDLQQGKIRPVAIELRDLTRAASYDAAIRWLAELLDAPAFAGVWLSQAADRAWSLRLHDGLHVHLPAVPRNIPDHRHAMVLAITAALEARR
jgi:hypothetical protein